MGSYNSPFEKSFISRTLAIVNEYKGEYDATLLINCLLGLVIIPNANYFDNLPLDPIEDITKWGITNDTVLSLGELDQKYKTKGVGYTVAYFVHHLRNAVSHFHVKPISKSGYVTAFEFWDTNGKKKNGSDGFRVRIPLSQMKDFVTRLATQFK